ncbi:MAG: glycosyltransferase family 2 protein [Lachnospiraceae bacterium]
MSKIKYYIDAIEIEPQECRYSIKCRVASNESVKIKVVDEKGNVLPYTNHMIGTKNSFFIQLSNIIAKRIVVVIYGDEDCVSFQIGTGKTAAFKNKISKIFRKGFVYLKENGCKEFFLKVMRKLGKNSYKAVKYEKWLPRHMPTQEKLEEQRRMKFSYTPKFSIVVPLYRTPVPFLEQMIESVLKQTYQNWELCLSDGGGEEFSLTEYLEKYKNQSRIKISNHKQPLKISANTNAAMSIATGDYIVFADHDDILTEHALYECAKIINQKKDLDMIYSDEDKMTMDGKHFFQPHMKPDFNIDLLHTVNYICHLLVVKKELCDKIGLLREEYDGAQDYDYILRCVEKAKDIYHIPQILYHWRSHESSTAENPESKLYAFEAGKRAIQDHYDRIQIQANVLQGEYLGLYKTQYIRKYNPMISILIPNKDHIEDLKRCMESLEMKSTYKNYEYIIIENNSTEESTFKYYKKLEDTLENIQIVYYKGAFNFSAINNYGATFAKGEYLLLLNNDTEIINEDCLEELLGYCMRPDVGAVGARLYFADDTVQHAGVIVGLGEVAGHAFVQQRRDETGYCHRIICPQDYSAVTAACMMVSKEDFNSVGGFEEELEIAFNDIDFCMKLRTRGKLNVYNPYAELYHYESKSRGLEDTPEKVARFNSEIELFKKRWPEILKKGDPFYNPNLTLESQDFSLRRDIK